MTLFSMLYYLKEEIKSNVKSCQDSVHLFVLDCYWYKYETKNKFFSQLTSVIKAAEPKFKCNPKLAVMSSSMAFYYSIKDNYDLYSENKLEIKNMLNFLKDSFNLLDDILSLFSINALTKYTKPFAALMNSIVLVSTMLNERSEMPHHRQSKLIAMAVQI